MYTSEHVSVDDLMLHREKMSPSVYDKLIEIGESLRCFMKVGFTLIEKTEFHNEMFISIFLRYKVRTKSYDMAIPVRPDDENLDVGHIYKLVMQTMRRRYKHESDIADVMRMIND